MFKIWLSACGNPDHGENPNSNIVDGIAVKSHWASADTIDELVKLARTFIETNNLGSGNWNGGEIINTMTNVEVGWMSYNGRVWGERR